MRHFLLPRRAVTVLALATAASAAGGTLAACGPRQVTVGTGEASAESSVEFTNNLSQAVNVYVRVGGAGEVFLRQVPARSTESVAVRGIAPGTSVTLRAAPVDGRQSYTQENIVLGRGVAWRVP
jgi:hypothetical protein